MKTRCKFYVKAVTRHGYQGPNGPVSLNETVKMSAICGGLTAEDVSFAENTPIGEFEFTVNNPKVIGSFPPGAAYYIDLIPAE